MKFIVIAIPEHNEVNEDNNNPYFDEEREYNSSLEALVANASRQLEVFKAQWYNRFKEHLDHATMVQIDQKTSILGGDFLTQ